MERYTYDAYGRLIVQTPGADGVFGTSDDDYQATSTVGNSYGFTARRLDPETGLMYYRARYYSLDQGRFVSRDPVGYVDGMNLYTAYFVPNKVDPTGTTDPAGATAVGLVISQPEVYPAVVAGVIVIGAEEGIRRTVRRVRCRRGWNKCMAKAAARAAVCAKKDRYKCKKRSADATDLELDQVEKFAVEAYMKKFGKSCMSRWTGCMATWWGHNPPMPKMPCD